MLIVRSLLKEINLIHVMYYPMSFRWSVDCLMKPQKKATSWFQDNANKEIEVLNLISSDHLLIPI